MPAKTVNDIVALCKRRGFIFTGSEIYGGMGGTYDYGPYGVELMKNIPSGMIADAHHWLLLHGRSVCTSRTPHCERCPFNSFCPKIMDGAKLA